MWIPIPITGTTHTVAVEGSVERLIACEHCGTEYIYTIEQVAQGVATALPFMDGSAASAVARQEAEKQLAAQLMYSCDPVPCPSCGYYQAAMVARMRMSHLHWMFRLGIFLCVLFPLFLGVSLLGTLVAVSANSFEGGIVVMVLWSLTFVIGVMAAALFIIRPQLVSRYNPNDEDAENRKKLGRRLAMPKADYLKMIEELRKKRLL